MVVTCLHGQHHPGQQEDGAQHQHPLAMQEPGLALGHRLAGRRLVTDCAENLGCHLTHIRLTYLILGF